MQIPFCKWSPGGNTTLFFPAKAVAPNARTHLAAQALREEYLCAEQVGYIDCSAHSLTMAGGEFCVNATRAFGAHLRHTLGGSHHTVTVSGWPDPIELTVTGTCPIWEVTAHLARIPADVEEQDTVCIVHLPGIDHILVTKDNYHLPQGKDAAATLHKALRERYALTQAPCVGLIWWTQQGAEASIRPLVWVRDTETLVWEQSCGSGTLALAIAQHATLDVTQPSGAILHVSDTGTISGSVTLVAEGQVWLT